MLGLVALTPGAAPAAPPTGRSAGSAPPTRPRSPPASGGAQGRARAPSPPGPTRSWPCCPTPPRWTTRLGELPEAASVHAKAAARLKALAASARGRRAGGRRRRGRRGRADGTCGANEQPGHRPADRGLRHRRRAELRRSAILGALDHEAVTRHGRARHPGGRRRDPAGRRHRHRRRPRRRRRPPREIGDGPHGSAGTGTNDFDFYKLTARGRRDAHGRAPPRPTGAAGHRRRCSTRRTAPCVASNDDSGGSLDSQIIYTVPAAGDVLRGRRGLQRAAGRPVRPGQRRRRRRARGRTR